MAGSKKADADDCDQAGMMIKSSKNEVKMLSSNGGSGYARIGGGSAFLGYDPTKPICSILRNPPVRMRILCDDFTASKLFPR
jgi:hypothetical protein